MSASPPSCPRCGSIAIEPTAHLTREPSVWAFLFGGFLLMLLWSGSRKKEARCRECSCVFEHATTGSRIFLVFFLASVLWIVLGWVVWYYKWD